MKLLFIIGSLSFGGAERVMSNLSKQFSQAGCDVSFLLFSKLENEYPVSPEVKKIYLDLKPQKNKLIKHFKYLKAIYNYFKIINPDITLSFLTRPNYYSTILKIIFPKKKFFASVRNVPEIEYPGKLKQLLATVLFRRLDGVIFQTEEAREWFESRTKLKNSAIIPNQVADQFFDKICNTERKNIVSVGRLDYQKNQSLLIKAFSKIKDKTDENLIIYGQGDKKEELTELIKELKLENRVFLAGIVKDVPNAIISSKLFVLSSDFEGSPNALLEAIALGIPSISTDCPCGGPKAIIRDGENGFLVPVGDVDCMANKMAEVLALPESELTRISENAKKSAERYRPENVFEEWKKYLLGE